MIGENEIEEALETLRVLSQDSSIPWHKFMQANGFDPEAIMKTADIHGDAMEFMGAPRFESAISFQTGFTLAVQCLLEERTNAAASRE